MERDKVEELVIDRSNYMIRLQEEYGRPDEYGYFLAIIEALLGTDQALGLFKENRNRGRRVCLLGRRVVSMHDEFIATLLSFLGDEALNAARWEKFFGKYREEFIKLYRLFLRDEPRRLLVFEVVNRKILRDILTQKLRGAEPLSAEAMDKVSRIINSLFYYARKVIASSVYIDDALVVEAYEKSPAMMPRMDEREIIKYLATSVQARKMPVTLFNALAEQLKGAVVETAEKGLLEQLSRRSIFSKEEFKSLVSAYPLGISGESVDRILSALKEKLATQLSQITSEKSDKSQKLIELRNKMREYVNTFAQKIYESTQHFSTQEILRSSVDEMTTPFIRMGYYIRDLEMQYQDMAKKEESMKLLLQVTRADVLAMTKDLSYRHLIEVAFLAAQPIKFDDAALQRLLKDAARAAKGNKAESDRIAHFRKGGLFTERFETERAVEEFRGAVREVVKPLALALMLEELVEYFPPLGTISQENVKYLAEKVADDDVCCLIDGEGRSRTSDTTRVTAEEVQEVDKFRTVTSVMVYDIRGSTFMGTKLKNAQKESEIRNLFNKAMLDVVGKYGGIPVKDIGDGGIVFFCENGREIMAAAEGGGVEAVRPRPGADTGTNVCRCAMEMVAKSEGFVQENLLKYSEWFKDAEEREIKFEGVKLATLPPEYKKIFQVGIGIASGFYPREVFLDRNVYGDLDVSGMLVREANIFSKAKNPEGSIILCDDTTVYNMVLNTPKISFVSEGGLKVDPIVADVIQALDYWLKIREQRQGFMVEMFRMSAKRVGGKISYDKDGKMFATVGDFGMSVRDEGFFLDSKGGRAKYLFEIRRA